MLCTASSCQKHLYGGCWDDDDYNYDKDEDQNEDEVDAVASW